MIADRFKKVCQSSAWFLAALLLPVVLHAASPDLHAISPPGAQRGTEIELNLYGQRLSDARGLLFYTPGIEVTDWKVTDEKSVHAKIKVSSDCALGDHPVRLWSATGISDVRSFFVGPFPVVRESGSNHDLGHAQPVPLNVTISGAIAQDESDYYSVEAKKGQRLTIEVEGIRLGRVLFDPAIALFDKEGRQIAANDDSSLFVQDPLLSIRIPEDGVYRFMIRDSSYSGGDNYRYRMHVGTFPQPVIAFPAGGPAGKDLDVELLGDVMGPIHEKVTIPNTVFETFPVFAEQDGQIAPAANLIRVSRFPNVLESEPNNDIAHATMAGNPLPAAFNGIVGAKGDIDYFGFSARKGEICEIRVHARDLRSPLDSVLTVFDEHGKKLGFNDDSGGPDSYLRFTAPGDGKFFLAVSDQLGRGGPEFVYRMEVTPVTPSVAFSIPQIVRDTQERQTIVIPRGNYYATPLQIKRADFDKELNLTAQNLPPGVTMSVDPVAPGSNTVTAVFEAAPDAPIGCRLVDLVATSGTNDTFHAAIEQPADVVIGPPNQTVYRQIILDKLAVSVAEEAPFKIQVVEPKVPLVQNGAMNLKIVADRKEGFKGSIEISLVDKPPGIGAQSSVKIPEGANETTLPLSANVDAKTAKWKIAAIGSEDDGKGKIYVGSAPAALEVAPPFVTAAIVRVNLPQGETSTVTCNLTQTTPFEGKAKLELLNLPGKATAEPVEITAADSQAQFKVSVDKITPPGVKRDLSCRLTIIKNGEPIVHTIGQGGIIRIEKAALQTAAK